MITSNYSPFNYLSLITLSLILLINKGFAQEVTDFIHVDQFGYLCSSQKIAVISDPQTGFNSSLSFTPGSTYSVKKVSDNTVVFSDAVSSWNNGNTDGASGDKGWWFNFSAVTSAGEYYIFDPVNNVRSYTFKISDNVYKDVLKHACRMYFYQRCNFPKQPPYADSRWADEAAFEGMNQDKSARPAWDKNNSSLARDVSGGWFDAGDYNKYVTFTYEALIPLLEAYRENPSQFPDNWGIPESGNGIPDILDEVKWELDWLSKMQDPDGSAYIKVGVDNYNDVSPPSADDRPRYYVRKCASASATLAAVFSLASTVYKGLGNPSMTTYANSMLSKAEASWNYITKINTEDERNCDDQNIKSGDADLPSNESSRYLELKVAASLYLWEASGTATYKSFFDTNYNSTRPFSETYWSPYRIAQHEALLRYTILAGNTASVATNIINNKTTDYAQNDFLLPPYDGNKSLYRAHMPEWAYTWGSNMTVSHAGNINLDRIRYGIDPSNAIKYRNIAEGYLHFLHGVNPINMVMLTNMYEYGAENCANEMYHNWFADKTIYDNAKTSPNGPAPGYLVGGFNKYYTVSSIQPPYGQPVLKAYKDWNTAWNGSLDEKSYEITEPGIYYQAAYIRLLSRINAFGSSCSLSSVEFGPVNTKITQQGVEVSWTTLTEKNASSFIIQRSLNGSEYEDIGTVNAKGNSTSSTSYNYTDPNSTSGSTIYYRIKHNLNGEKTYSAISTLSITNILEDLSKSFNVVPNPFSEFTIISGFENSYYRITELTGKLMEEGELTSSREVGKRLPKGIYTLEVITESTTKIIKVIKE